jgi:hypothetical protein
MEVVMIRTKDGRTLAINQNMIIGAEFSGDPVVKSKTAYEVARAKLKFGGKGDKADLTMAYLEKGINWSPSYLINIADPAQADITMEAVLANDAEDLEDVDVSFVVGYPNFMFADNFCPLTPGQTIAEFVRRLSESSSRPRDIDGRVTSQSTWNFALDNSVLTRSGVWSPNSVYSANQPLPGESNEDLYFYHQGNVSLKKGERARYTVFTAKVPYEHVYQWRIADTMKIDDHGYRRDNNADKDQPDPVWHSLRLTNTTQYPWTTAPALVTNGSMPLSQDVLNYVAAGGAKTLLRLTVASDVRGQQVQTEAKRERVELPGYYCDKVTVDGKLSVANWKKTPIRLNVVKSLVGEVVTAGDAGKTSKVVKSLTGLNPTSEIVWEFDLKPNEEKVLTYQYTAFVRR